MLKAVKFAAVLVILVSMPALAEINGALRIGVLNDMSSVYADFQGPGSVLAAQIAVEDFAKQSKRKIEVISADHQNKPDVGAGIARRWFDVEGVDMIIDLPDSAVALAVSDIAREEQGRNRVRRWHRTSHRSEMLAQFRALDLRYLGQWPCTGARSSFVRREVLVLYHSRLCLRTRSRKAG